MEILTFLVKLKRIVLHTNVKCCEKLISRMIVQNVHDNWQRMLLAANIFVWLT